MLSIKGDGTMSLLEGVEFFFSEKAFNRGLVFFFIEGSVPIHGR